MLHYREPLYCRLFAWNSCRELVIRSSKFSENSSFDRFPHAWSDTASITASLERGLRLPLFHALASEQPASLRGVDMNCFPGRKMDCSEHRSEVTHTVVGCS